MRAAPAGAIIRLRGGSLDYLVGAGEKRMRDG
jgi:hypothetical protein